MNARALRFAVIALAVAAGSVTLPAQYSLTVNKDRLINAQNEPQNWLLMNGDYGSLRYSKLTQINRENVKNLRMVWAMALGGMQDVGQNGPENELNPLIDNGFMYTSDGWGTIYKIDARNPGRGSFVWIADPGVQHEGNVTRTRGIALWEDKVIANLPDGRVIAVNRDNGEIVWDKKITTKNEFGNQERFLTAPLVADGKVLVQNGAGDGGTRGWVAALDVKDGKELWRWYTVPKPGRPGQRNLEGRPQRVEDRRRRHLADRLVRRGAEPLHRRHRQPVPDLRPAVPPRRQPVHQLGGRARRRHRQDGVVLPVHAERLVGLRRDRRLPALRHRDQRQPRKVVGHFGRNGFFYSIDRTNGRFIKAEKYVNDLNWTKGINPETGKPYEYNPKLDVQVYNPEARALRGDGKKRTCPTWHGGVAHQPLAFNPIKNIAYGVGTEGCFTQNGAAVGVLGKDGGVDNKASQPRQYSSDLYYGALTAFDAVNHKVIGKAVTDIEIRSGATATAGGLVFTALQDGWVVAYNDETLEELWRFNVGTPLKGAPVTYAIGPKQYLAVQAGGRHLHPVNWDKLENSSYLFVFALN